MNKIIRPAGKLYSKGVGIFGALGNGALKDLKCFEEVSFEGMKPIRSISAGWGHSAVVTGDGELIIFGRPYDFQAIMRLNSLYNVFKPMGRFVSNLTPLFGNNSGVFDIPQLVSGVDAVEKACVSAGLTGILTVKGDVYMFGQNRWGQCGVDSKVSYHVYDPIKISLPAPVADLDIGLQHCIAVLTTGHVYTWGKGTKGQIGQGTFDSSPMPVLISDKDVFTANVSAVSAGFNHSVALSRDGRVFVWGKGMSTELKPKTSSIGKC